MSTTYQMRLHPQPFDDIRAGRKTIEVRLNDEKRQCIKVGDRIEFLKRPDFAENILVEVTDLLRAPTFEEMYALLSKSECGVMDAAQYYTKEDEQKYGSLGMRFRVIQTDA